MPSALLRFLSILLFLFACNFISAQQVRTSFKGLVVDEADLPVPGVTIMVLSAADSILVQFASSDEQGNFILKNVPPGNHLINFFIPRHADHLQACFIRGGKGNRPWKN